MGDDKNPKPTKADKDLIGQEDRALPDRDEEDRG